ncbi:MAG: histidinol-phosphatase [Anaerolineae bacterium]|nr:histidinol-phosphatase [Anaerolineae bacterium]
MSTTCLPCSITCNLHTHTRRCKHATGAVVDYARAAIDRGLAILGISDHTPLPDNRWINVRMDFSELRAYNDEIDAARDAHPELVILKGMECEYAAEYVSFYRDTLLGELGFDFLIGGAHYFPYRGAWANVYDGTTDLSTLQAYASYVIESMACGLFAFIAHPDLFGNAYLRWDANAVACAHDILRAAEAFKMPLEINGYGLRKPVIDTPDGPRRQYPWLSFWKLAAGYDVPVIVNSDAHRPEDIVANMREGLAMADACGLSLVDMSRLVPARTVQHADCLLPA